MNPGEVNYIEDIDYCIKMISQNRLHDMSGAINN
jgi:hypothetical protein